MRSTGFQKQDAGAKLVLVSVFWFAAILVRVVILYSAKLLFLYFPTPIVEHSHICPKNIFPVFPEHFQLTLSGTHHVPAISHASSICWKPQALSITETYNQMIVDKFCIPKQYSKRFILSSLDHIIMPFFKSAKEKIFL